MDLQQFLAFLPLMPQSEEDDPIPPWLRRLLRELRSPVLGGPIGRPEVHQLPAAQARGRATAPNPNRVMQERGILPQMAADDTARARRMYEAIYPVDYGATQRDPEDDRRVVEGEAARGQNRAIRASRALLGMENSPRIKTYPAREDAWRLYLGLPQQSGTFAVSGFRPSRSNDPGATYFSIPGFFDKVRDSGLNSGTSVGTGTRIDPASTNRAERDIIRELVAQARGRGGGRVVLRDGATGVMGDFTIGIGQDERGYYVSYYDKWDLAPGGIAQRVANRVGVPFEIYDRIYYDPRTFDVIQPRRRNP